MHIESCYHRRPMVWTRGARALSDFSDIVQGRNEKLKTTILKHLGLEKFTIEAKNSNKIQYNSSSFKNKITPWNDL